MTPSDDPLLDASRLLDQAVRDTGLDDFGGDEFQPGLERLVASLTAQADLHAGGRAAVCGALSRELRNRLFACAARKRHSAVADVAIERPVFVVGLLRTGTTLLHNLLSVHPQLYAPALWELAFPVSETPGPVEDRALVAAAQGYVDEYNRVAPALKSIHYLQADRPDECHRLTANAFLSKVYEMRYRVPDYGRWLASRSMTPGYRHHRGLLQHIAWRRAPDRVGRDVRFVLKCPFHFWSLPDLLSVYPDAQVVLLHRDVRKVAPSMSSLCRTIRAPYSATVDPESIGRWVLGDVEAGVERVLAWRADAPSRSILDVRYHDLVHDRAGTLARILSWVDLPCSDAYMASVADWQRHNHEHRFGRHRYDAAEFGLDADHIAERFTAYHRKFDIPAEATRAP